MHQGVEFLQCRNALKFSPSTFACQSVDFPQSSKHKLGLTSFCGFVCITKFHTSSCNPHHRRIKTFSTQVLHTIGESDTPDGHNTKQDRLGQNDGIDMTGRRFVFLILFALHFECFYNAPRLSDHACACKSCKSCLACRAEVPWS